MTKNSIITLINNIATIMFGLSKFAEELVEHMYVNWDMKEVIAEPLLKEAYERTTNLLDALQSQDHHHMLMAVNKLKYLIAENESLWHYAPYRSNGFLKVLRTLSYNLEAFIYSTENDSPTYRQVRRS